MIDYYQLLGRKEVEFDLKGLSDFLLHKHVLVTGAGGSIGSEICRALWYYGVPSLVSVSRSEANLINLTYQLEGWCGSTRLKSYVGDVTDPSRMEFIFTNTKPDLVFHAAAHKHVPLMESNPGEAIKNNVFGTQVVTNACVRHGAQIVLVSTDKASRPCNVMGATKRLAEMCVQQASNGRDGFCVARMVNVIGSSGSLLEIWQKQLAADQPISVTHPDMTRYFITPKEAATLLLKAASISRGNERFVLDMNEPTRILELAERFLKLQGVDCAPKITGIRPGEKIQEDSPCEDVDRWVSPGIRSKALRTEEDIWSHLSRAVNGSSREVMAELQACLPEYQPMLR